MNDIVDRVKRIVMLDATAYDEVASDDSATGPAFGLAVLSGFVGSIGTAITTEGFGIGSALSAAVIGAPLGLLIGTGVMFLIGKLFGGSGEFMGMLRAFGHASPVQMVGIIPVVGGLIALFWGVACWVVGVREVHNISTGAAVATVLIPVVILGAMAVVLAIAIFAALTGAVS